MSAQKPKPSFQLKHRERNGRDEGETEPADEKKKEFDFNLSPSVSLITFM